MLQHKRLYTVFL